MNDIHKAIFFSALEKYGSFIFFIFATAILARLLTPEEFGIFALVNAITTIAASYFHEFGGANYIIQKDDLSERNIRTAFTVTLITSSFVALLLLLLRGVAAQFFSQEGLRLGLAVCAINFLLVPVSVVLTALLRREMSFGTLGRCNIIANIANSLSSIALAAVGYSYMAPIYGVLIGTVVLTILLLMHVGNIRALKPSLQGYREVLEFGAYSGAVVIINVLYQWSPQLFLGRMLDFSAVGLYTRAVSITQIFDRLVFQVLNPIIMPAVFAQTRSGVKLKDTFLSAIELLSVLQWPFLIFLAIMSHTIILLWLGPTWIEIVPLVQLLSIASLSLVAASLTYPVLVGVGRIQDTVISSLISLPPSFLVVLLASYYGAVAVAASALVTFPFQAAVALYFIGKRLGIKPIELAKAVLKSAAVALITSLAVLVSVGLTKYAHTGAILELISASTFAAAGWIVALFVTNHRLLEQLKLVARGIVGFVRMRLS